MEENTDSIEGSVKALEKALGVHEGFLEGLINELDFRLSRSLKKVATAPKKA
ncbi:hypothetical protein [Geobacter argillaceus]|uniref:hypothetical protein n=1 Tax=Geobacter argillaceus TaxID=345631 RepID=UPI00147878D7|nr:hypothetical protein [Geobacter argillaceus]